LHTSTLTTRRPTPHSPKSQNDAKLAKAEGVKAPAMVLYKSFDNGKDTFEGKFDKDTISKFIKTSAIPLVGEVGPETYAGYMAVCTTSYPCGSPY